MKKIILLGILLSLMLPVRAGEELVLENDRIRAVFNPRNGSLNSLVSKLSGWRIVDRASLGRSFELLMPLEDRDRRFHLIQGIRQQAPLVERQADRITFTWAGMRSEELAGTVEVSFIGTVRLTPTGLEFSGELVNKSPYPVEYVSWPVLGEVSVPDKTRPLYHTTRSDSRELFPHFYNEHGYWGVDYPTSTYYLPEHAFVLVHNEEQGFLLHRKETFPYAFLIQSFELIPGFELRNTNPYMDTMDGQAVRIQAKSNRILYNRPGETSTLEPVCLSVYNGTWHTALDLYKAGQEKPSFVSPPWINRPLSWQAISISRGSELAREAKDARELGVNVLLVKGWYGLSDGRPEEVPGLSEAIGECHRMGVRVVLETNWTRISKQWTPEKGVPADYVMRDPWGVSYTDSYLCPLGEAEQNRIREEWSELPSLQVADGVMNADNNHADKSYFCFAPGHGHRIGEPTASGTMSIDAIMAERIRYSGEERKVILGYGFLDDQHLIYDGYRLSVSSRQDALHRYLHPQMPILSAIDVRNAREEMNRALLHRFTIVHDKRLKDYPHIVAYAQKVEAFRNRYAGYLWDAEYIDPKVVAVEGNGLVYSVFRNKGNGKKAVVVANTRTEVSSTVKLHLETGSAFTCASPENQEMKPYAGIEIQPQSVMVFFEQ